ncbi:ASCH domain-containing protein [Brevibacillus laterosporus]|uniref:ASCH domain-containing protein n=1 Tax=Brevibacillus laterosporus TaxID=1465 RepID=UPI00035E22C2|nr:ASCH domain-containing protein [Brevibacillus laterosporus]ATO48411.1 2-oxoglutarate dehydrogenase E1 [Brevibacillus laterosporus DSM 25]AYB36838.1 ASCH domain-containing protein [Brevibacillus laterosporus]MBG9803190.1 2-oxoglutarate dehydrogenase E1 [Brevibacillus laterosporus]MBM7111394.1 ASCH domain protein [Brevibacillus laterosporus]MED2002124.1 ASCH domain-containing protein [Brevibacillus laterosporus]
MKAITIHQPWATLIALGEKEFETRSWRTKYRGELAIHAGKKVDKEACQQEPFRSVLAKYGLTADNLPTGAIVATCLLTECLQVHAHAGFYAVAGDSNHQIEGNEYAFGWYELGRFAWKLTNVKQVELISARGKQGLWNWNK